MNPAVLLIQRAEREGSHPTHLYPALLAGDLHAAGFPTVRWLVHDVALRDLVAREDFGPWLLVLCDADLPAADVEQICGDVDPCPVVLYGARALDRFEVVPALGALVGPVREGAVQLARSIRNARDGVPPEAELKKLPRLFYRARRSADGGEVWRASVRWPELPADRVLLPLHPVFDWEYIGPTKSGAGRRPPLGRIWWPATAVAGPRERATTSQRLGLARGEDPSHFPIDPHPRYDPSAADRVRTLYGTRPPDRKLALAAGSLTSEERISLVLAQIERFTQEGTTAFRIETDDPFDILRPLTRTLVARELVPREIVLSPSTRALKESDALRRELEPLLAAGARVTLHRIRFGSFDDRNLLLAGYAANHWDNRWVARQLLRLNRTGDGRFRTLSQHRLDLIDPWSRVQDILDTLVAVEEDAPFLKPEVHPGSLLPAASPYDRLGRRARAEGLWRRSASRSGWSYDFRNEEIREYLDLAQQGWVPLVEAIGRMRLAPSARRRMIVEGRFRWMRELALHVQRGGAGEAPARESWGKILRSVTRDLAAESQSGR